MREIHGHGVYEASQMEAWSHRVDGKAETCVIMVPRYGSDLLSPLVNMYTEACENKSALFILFYLFLSQKSKCYTSKISASVCVCVWGGGESHYERYVFL